MTLTGTSRKIARLNSPSISAAITARRFMLVLALLGVAAHLDVFLGLRTFVARDFGGYTYPLALHLRESIWSAEWPLWNPYARCGLPFLAQWNTLVLYPPSLVYVVLPL